MDPKPPKITVLMCVFNTAPYLRDSLDSILAQTYADFELLIIDDGSTDESASIIETYSDPRIRFYRHDSNMGLSYSDNHGLALANGEYIAIQDSDDIALPNRLEIQVNCLDADPGLGLVGTWVEYMDSHGNVPRDLPDTIQRGTTDPSLLKWLLLFYCDVAHCSVMYRKELALEVGGYGNYQFCEDYVLICRISQRATVINLPQILQRYRINPTGFMSSTNDDLKMQEVAAIVQTQLQEFLQLPVPLEVIRILRAYSFAADGSPPALTNPPPLVHPYLEQAFMLYLQLYSQFRATYALSPAEQAPIREDVIRQTDRLICDFSPLGRLQLILKNGGTLPQYCWTPHFILCILAGHKQVVQGRQIKRQLRNLLGQAHE